MMAVLTALLLLLLPRTCHAVVLRPAAPPRGWNSFEGPGCDGCGHDNATNILQLADLFTGLLKGPDSGWKYIEMDGGWQTNNNNFSDYLFDKNGRMVPDPVRFPGGLAPLAAKLKAKGLVLGGWYIRGVEKTQLSKPVLGAEHYTLGDLVTSAALHGHKNGSCPWSPNWLGVNMSHPAAEIYYDGVAALLVDTYGLGMIKMDCSWGSGWLHADEVAAMSRSLDKAKGEVVFSLSPGGGCSVQEAKWASSGDDGAACADKNGKWMDGPGPGAASAGASMYRITTDFHGGRVLGQLQAALPFLNASLAGLNNSYMDLDMLPTLNRDGDAWIQGEKSTLLSIWSLVRSPILLAGNLEAALADAPTLASLVNPVAASVHATGQNVRVVTATKDLCVLASEFTLPPAVALTTGATAATAVTVTNLAANDTAPGPVSFQSLGLASGGTVRDVWTGQAVPSDTTGWSVDAMWSSGTRFYYVTHSASSSSTASTASSTGAPAAPLTIIKSDDEAEAPPVMFHVLQPADFAHLLQEDLPWAEASIPFFESSDPNLTAAYYYRWRVLKTHIHNVSARTTPGPQTDWVITEFSPKVGWAGRDNSIICAAGHHLMDARWLRDGANSTCAGEVADSYSAWYASGLRGVKYNYYGWVASAILQRLQVAGDARFLPLVKQILPDLQVTVLQYLNGSLPGGRSGSFFDHTNNCVWNWPGVAGQEHNPSGGGCQPLTQALLYGEANAVAQLCQLAGDVACASEFAAAATKFQQRLLKLWNKGIEAFDTLMSPQPPPGASDDAVAPATAAVAPAPAPWAGVRTLSSLSSPWYFNAIPEAQAAQFAGSWKSAFDPQGIGGKYGLRTAEKRTVPGNHYRQKYPYSCYAHDCCYWGGPVWPFESAKALTGAANVLQNPKLASVVEGAASGLTRSSLWMMLANYTAMHGDQWTVTNFTDGSRADYQELNRSGYFLSGLGLEQSQGTAGHAMWIAEAGCADDATWTDNPSGGYLYEHSTYMDIVLQVVVGLVPKAAGPKPTLQVQPLLPSDSTLRYFAVDAAMVGGRVVSVLWDADGKRYNKGQGLTVMLDGKVAATAKTLQGASALTVPLG